jgi:hypothetical protein
MSTVRIDAQGRIVERRRAATVSTAPDGLPIVEFTEPRPVTIDEALEAIRAQRDAR